jgi:hypothetical protein
LAIISRRCRLRPTSKTTPGPKVERGYQRLENAKVDRLGIFRLKVRVRVEGVEKGNQGLDSGFNPLAGAGGDFYEFASHVRPRMAATTRNVSKARPARDKSRKGLAKIKQASMRQAFGVRRKGVSRRWWKW